MTMTWTRPAEDLTDGARGWDGVWTLVYAAGQAAMNLAAVPGADDDLALMYAALDVSYALTEIESLGRDVVTVAVNLGSVDLTDRDAGIAVIDDLLGAAQALATELIEAPEVGASLALCGSRVTTLLGSARAKVTGGSW